MTRKAILSVNWVPMLGWASRIIIITLIGLAVPKGDAIGGIPTLWSTGGYSPLKAYARPFELMPAQEHGRSSMSTLSVEDDDEEVAALATELGERQASAGESMEAKALRIFNWVRNNIDYEQYGGFHKGAELTLLEGSGNDYDQADLLAKLLLKAGFTSEQVKFKLGEQLVTYDKLVNWVGLSASPLGTGNLGDRQAAVGKSLLDSTYTIGRGTNGETVVTKTSTLATFQFVRLWVFLKIGINEYNLDPSYKQYETVAAGSGGLLSAMGYNRGSLMTEAGGTVGDDGNSIRNLDDGAIQDYLDARTLALQAAIKSSWNDKTLDYFISKRRIIKEQVSSLNNAFPLPANFNGGISEYAIGASALELGYTAYLTLVYGAVNDEYPSNFMFQSPVTALKGKKLSITFTGTNHTTLNLMEDDVQPRYSVDLDPSWTAFRIQAIIDYPWNPNAVFPDSTNGLVYKRHATNDYAYVLPYTCKASTRLLQKRYEKLQKYLNEGKEDDDLEVRTELLYILGLTWYYQSDITYRALAAMNSVIHTHLHRFGRVGQEKGYFVDMPLQLASDAPNDAPYPWDIVNSDPSVVARVGNTFQLSSLFMSAMEHGVIEQMQDGAPAISTVEILRKASTGTANRLMLLNPGNHDDIVANDLTNYDQGEKDTIALYVEGDPLRGIPAGKALVPRNGNVNQGSWTGAGLLIRNPSAAGMLITGGYSGGYATTADWIVSPPISSWFSYNPAVYYEAPSLMRDVVEPIAAMIMPFFGSDPVDMYTGAFTFATEDISVGTGEAPWRISFTRQYSSAANELDKQGLGFGWTHTLNMRVVEQAAAEQVLAQSSPYMAAPFLVAANIASDLYREDGSAKEWGTAVHVAGWLQDFMKQNAVTVRIGNENYQFFKQIDGTYTPPAGTKMELQKTGSTFVFKQRLGNKIEFRADGLATRIEDPDGNFLTLSYNTADNLRDVEGPGQLHFRFIYPTGSSYTDEEKDRIIEIQDLTDTSLSRSVYFYYDNKGNLERAVDPEGKNEYYDYSVAGDPSGTTVEEHRMVRMRNNDNETVTQNVYDSLGRVSLQYLHGDTGKTFRLCYTGDDNYQIDPSGGVTHFYYDEKGRPIGQLDALGNKTETVYDNQDRVRKEISAELEETVYHYDDQNNVTQIDYPRGGGSAFFVYDSLGRLDYTLDPNGAKTDYQYAFASGLDLNKDRPIGIVTAQGTADEYRTDFSYVQSGVAKGKLASVTTYTSGTSGGLTTQYTYDSNGFPYQTTPPGLSPTTYTYSDSGLLKLEFRPINAHVTFYDYNLRGQPLSIQDTPGDRVLTSYTYDNQGRVASVREAGATKSFTYSPTGKVLLEKVNNVTVANHHYDGRDWEDYVDDAVGRRTNFIYKANGDLESVQGPLSRTSTFVADGDGRMTGEVNPGANTGPRAKGYVYDVDASRGNLPRTVTTDSDNKTLKEVFDRLGRPRFFVDKKNGVFEYQYDATGRQKSIQTPLDASLGRATATTYLDNGSPSVVTEPSGDTITTAYSSTTGRVSSVAYQKAGGSSSTVNFNSYDVKGNVLNLSETGPGSIARTYTPANSVESYTTAAGTVEYGYEMYSGLLTGISYPGGGHVNYTYWPDGRLKEVVDHLTSTTRTTTYTWLPDGRLDTIVRPNGTVRDIDYDAAGRPILITEKTSGGTIITQYNISGYYQSDEIQALASVPVIPKNLLAPIPSVTMTHDSGNQVATFNGQLVVHDADGNMTSGPLPSGTMGSYVYDSRNRLTSAGGLNYAYDAEGNRIGISGSETQSFVVDPNTGLTKVLARTKNGQTTRYVYGIGLLYELDAAGNAIYYHYDYSGSTTALTNDSQAVVDRIAYAPYGQIRYRQSNYDTPFLFGGFFGAMTDSNGLIYMRARYYNPLTCRFINSDPARVGSNWFAYAGGNPVSFADPTGFGPESTLDVIQAGLSVLGFIPIIGEAFDVLNGAISLARGNYADAALNFASAIPFAGNAFAAAKIARTAYSVGKFEGKVVTTDAAAMARASGCFARGTPISTSAGSRPIEDIQVGDQVYAYDLDENKVVESRVLEVYRRTTTEWKDVHLEGGDVLRATPEHPFWIPTANAWIGAGDLQPGMQVLRQDGSEEKVLEVVTQRLSEPETTYNFNVQGQHNYFVGEIQALVHNSCEVVEAFESFNDARAHAVKSAGLSDKTVPFVNEIGPLKGKITGSMSADGKRGWRVDWDDNKNFHVNWWDRTGGVKRKDWKYGANTVPAKTKTDFDELLDHAFPKN